MDIRFTDSFEKSLKDFRWHNSRIYKTYSLFRYDIPNFLKNIWKFRRELWNHRWWDYRFTLDMFSRSLTILEEGIRVRGHEVDASRIPKVNAMKRAIEILNKNEILYIEMAEAQLGNIIYNEIKFQETENGGYQLVDNDTPEEKEHNRKVYDLAKEIEEKEWSELWEIFKGTENSKEYGEKYDGTDMRSWWD